MLLHLIDLINFLQSQRFNWLEHMPRKIALGTSPFVALAAILILHFYIRFYQFLLSQKTWMRTHTLISLGSKRFCHHTAISWSIETSSDMHWLCYHIFNFPDCLRSRMPDSRFKKVWELLRTANLLRLSLTPTSPPPPDSTYGRFCRHIFKSSWNLKTTYYSWPSSPLTLLNPERVS